MRSRFRVPSRLQPACQSDRPVVYGRTRRRPAMPDLITDFHKGAGPSPLQRRFYVVATGFQPVEGADKRQLTADYGWHLGPGSATLMLRHQLSLPFFTHL